MTFFFFAWDGPDGTYLIAGILIYFVFCKEDDMLLQVAVTFVSCLKFFCSIFIIIPIQSLREKESDIFQQYTLFGFRKQGEEGNFLSSFGHACKREWYHSLFP